MLMLLSPAKTLDFDTPVPAVVQRRVTAPRHADGAAELIALLRRKSATQVAELMELSPALAELNVARYAAWTPQATPQNSKPALLAFAGDVYEGLQAATLNTAALDWAQRHVLLLSGLYGALRPLDALQPYRLEMGTALAHPGGRDLYSFWGDTVVQDIHEHQQGEKHPVVLNLASQEYSRVALRPTLRSRVIECVFEDWKGGQYKVISFFAKRARGLMCRFVIDERLRGPARLKEFKAEGYAFAPQASGDDRLVFRRRVE